MPYFTGTHFAQLGIKQGDSATRLFARATQNNGQWTPTVELYHTGNLKPEAILPAGCILYCVAAEAPAGFLPANGAAISRTTYASLFKVIGTVYGAGDGVGTFNLPDLRGVFVRGWDGGRKLDPDRVIGTVQTGQNATHTHSASLSVAGDHTHAVNGTTLEGGDHFHYVTKAAGSNNTPGPYVTPANGAGSQSQTTNSGNHTHSISAQAAAAGAHTHAITINTEGGEARPINIALLPCIKY
nr:phage tail protein [Pseudomonas entomophila]